MANKYSIKPSEITIGVDTREQEGWTSELESQGFNVTTATLPTGDVTVLVPDLSNVVVIERKTLGDLVASITQGRDRFSREVFRMRAYRYPYLVIESTATSILEHAYRSKTNELSVLGSLSRFASLGISVLFCDNRKAAAYMVGRLLFFIANEIVGYSAQVFQQLEIKTKGKRNVAR